MSNRIIKPLATLILVLTLALAVSSLAAAQTADKPAGPAPSKQESPKPSPVSGIIEGPALEDPANQETRKPSPGTGIIELPASFDATPPQATWRPDPSYTEEAIRHHVDGIVVVSFLINAEGDVTDVELKSPPLGYGLDESVLGTVRTWKFRPAMRDGKPVPVRVGFKMIFRYFDRRNAPPGDLITLEDRPAVMKGVTPAKPVFTPDPEYTDKARRAGLEGTVNVEVNIDKKGRVTGAIAMGPELGMGLDKQAVKAARKWKFEPATLDGKPVAVVGKVQVKFKL
ncbi:MAG TPA: TonB family protein [Terriglobia bacterium]|nr:TonB family protein [Terriglobia bacterium]